MNRILIFDHHPSQKNVTIHDEQTIRHCHDVLNVKVGDKLQLCLVNQSLAQARVEELGPHIHLFIEETWPGLTPPYHLQVAASRPPTMKKILEHGTSLGVQSFSIFKGELSDKSYLQSRLYHKQQLEPLLRYGLAQAKSLTHLPTVTVDQKLDVPAGGQKFVLSLNTSQTFAGVPIDFTRPLHLAIGPERGWTMEEEQSLLEQGYQAINISQMTLRVEIATFVALGQLELLRLKTLESTS